MKDMCMNVIICVDDDVITSSLLKHEIDKYKVANCEIYSEKSAESALTRIENFKDSVKILISDFGLPGMSGLELIKIVGEKYPNIKKIMISGYDRIDLQNSVSNCEIFVKPWDKQRLKSYILSVIA